MCARWTVIVALKPRGASGTHAATFTTTTTATRVNTESAPKIPNSGQRAPARRETLTYGTHTHTHSTVSSEDTSTGDHRVAHAAKRREAREEEKVASNERHHVQKRPTGSSAHRRRSASLHSARSSLEHNLMPTRTRTHTLGRACHQYWRSPPSLRTPCPHRHFAVARAPFYEDGALSMTRSSPTEALTMPAKAPYGLRMARSGASDIKVSKLPKQYL